MALFDIFGLFDLSSRRHKRYVDALLDRVYDDLEWGIRHERRSTRTFLVKGPPTDSHPWPWSKEDAEEYFKEE